MPTSDRVLSGSITKGSTATLTGSVKYFYQGINSRDMSVYYGSLVPRVGSGDRTKLYKLGNPLSEKIFDDSIILNNTPDDMGGETDIRIEQRVGFDYEKRNFGQPPTVPQGEPFADAIDYDPVKYLEDPSEVMWPVNLWNLGDLPDYEYDGVIEPLDIRREILGFINTDTQGHGIRASLVGASSEKPWGSIEIKSHWKINEKQSRAFLDAPDAMSIEDDVKFSMQPFQDVRPAPCRGFTASDYHNTVYSSFNFHNSQDMIDAMKLLNSSSCESISSPLEKRASSGFYFSKDAGSIIFGDTAMLGEHE